MKFIADENILLKVIERLKKEKINIKLNHQRTTRT